MRIPNLAALAVISALVAVPAMAQEQFPDFETMDANKDGRVTKEEFLASLTPEQRRLGERVFAARDANKDGVLTRDEVARERRD